MLLNKRGALSVLQIMILVVGVVAIGWAVGGGIGIVESANGQGNAAAGEASVAVLGAGGLATAGGLAGASGSGAAGFWFILSGKFGSALGWGGAAGAGTFYGLVSGVVWAAVAYGVLKTFLPMLGASAITTEALAAGVAAGIFAGFLTHSGWVSVVGVAGGGALAGVTALVMAGIVFAIVYKDTDYKIYTFQGKLWHAPTGGWHCDECNDNFFGCSEYQCRSLGSSWELINEEGSGDQVCFGAHKNDNEPPIIRPWDGALPAIDADGDGTNDYDYEPISTKVLSPPDKGVYVHYLGDENTGEHPKEPEKDIGCVPAFTMLSFGITTNEPAYCKLDPFRTDNFTDMGFDFGGSSTFKDEHIQLMSLPNPSALEEQGIVLENGNEMEFFVRCTDTNGNTNINEFVFQICVDDGPDTTPPLIVTADPMTGLPFAFGENSLTAKVYINEPAECRWNRLDKDYEEMADENGGEMNCPDGPPVPINAMMLSECTVELTGLLDGKENKFYFRCKDQPGLENTKPENRNTNVESYEYILHGSKELVITESGPEGVIKDSTDPVKVELTATTFAGYQEGGANCYWKDSELEDSAYVVFEEEGNFDTVNHVTPVWFEQEIYDLDIMCLDLAGNADNVSVSFEVEVDETAPVVVRAYKEENSFKVVTNEPAECVYDSVDCTYIFDDGIKMNAFEDVDHFTNWNSNSNLYIKCRDKFLNEPAPNKCSLIVRPFETYISGSNL